MCSSLRGRVQIASVWCGLIVCSFGGLQFASGSAVAMDFNHKYELLSKEKSQVKYHIAKHSLVEEYRRFIDQSSKEGSISPTALKSFLLTKPHLFSSPRFKSDISVAEFAGELVSQLKVDERHKYLTPLLSDKFASYLYRVEEN